MRTSPKVNIADKIIKITASVCYLGFLPIASGTAGALPGAAISILLIYLNFSPFLYAIITLLMVISAIPVCTRAEKIFGVKDSPHIVLDEMVSMPITMFLVPLKWQLIIAAFILNRLADIVKVPPAYQSQKLNGGLGIVMDDVVAGIYSNLAMQALVYLLPW